MIDTAKNLSMNSKLHSRHGCLIVKKNKILSLGINEIGNRVMGKTVPTIHAEMSALSLLKKSTPKLRKSTYRSLPTTAKKQWFKEVGYLYSKGRCRGQFERVKALFSLLERASKDATF